MKDPGRAKIDAKADDAYAQHQPAFYLKRGREAVIGFNEYPGCDQPECQGIQQGCQDLKSMITKGALHGGGPLGEHHGDQGDGNGCRIGQHMPCIGKQGQTAGQDAAGNFNEHITGDQYKSSDQAALAGTAQIVGMVMPGSAVMMMVMAMAATLVVCGVHSHYQDKPLNPDRQYSHTDKSYEYQNEFD